MFSGIVSFISGLFGTGGVGTVIDNLVTSDEEKLKLRNELAKIESEVVQKLFEYESKLMETQSNIIVAEAKSESSLARNWRPIVMLTFCGLVVAKWFGFSAPGIAPEIEAKLFDIVQIGLGGYIAGRSAEKIMKEYKRPS